MLPVVPTARSSRRVMIRPVIGLTCLLSAPSLCLVRASASCVVRIAFLRPHKPLHLVLAGPTRCGMRGSLLLALTALGGAAAIGNGLIGIDLGHEFMKVRLALPGLERLAAAGRHVACRLPATSARLAAAAARPDARLAAGRDFPGRCCRALQPDARLPSPADTQHPATLAGSPLHPPSCLPPLPSASYVAGVARQAGHALPDCRQL